MTVLPREVNDMNSQKNHNALLYRLWEEEQKQVVERNTPAQQEKCSQSSSMQGAGEKLQMIETRIYIGLNDAQTKEQIHETEKYMSVLKRVCQSYHVAFSVDIEKGGYFHDNGEYTEENTFVLTLINADKKVVSEIAIDLCSFFHQESVLVTENRIDGYFVRGESFH